MESGVPPARRAWADSPALGIPRPSAINIAGGRIEPQQDRPGSAQSSSSGHKRGTSTSSSAPRQPGSGGSQSSGGARAGSKPITPTLGMMRRTIVALAEENPLFVERSSSRRGAEDSPIAPTLLPSPSRGVPTPTPPKTPRGGAQRENIRFDVLTLRQWFNEMDADGSGGLDKQEWLNFLRKNPKLKNMMLRGRVGQGVESTPDANSKFEQGREDAKEIKRLLRIWREIDIDKSGTLEWEEFVEFFRRSGNLLEYETASPKARLAEMMGTFNENQGSVTEKDMREFEHLAGKHLPADLRRKLGQDARRKLDPESPGSAREKLRQACRTGAAVGLLTTPRCSPLPSPTSSPTSGALVRRRDLGNRA